MKAKFIFVILIFISTNVVFSRVVDSNLGKELTTIFPELKDGYIDLNNNDKADQMDDFDENIPESAVKDGIMQVQEILDFIKEYYMYIPIEKLRAVSSSLSGASGPISEIISLNYSAAIADILVAKAELDGDGLYLTPSALKEANEKMSGYISSMLIAYKKENSTSETAFINSRDELFRMIVAGYPLPDLSVEDKNLLINAMIHTIIKEKDSEQERVKAAIRTLGRTKADTSIVYLIELLDSPVYKVESIRALGNIGSETVLDLLMEELTGTDDEIIKNTAIQSLGKIGGEESLTVLITLLPKDTDEEIVSLDTERAVLKAISDLAGKDNTDRRIFPIISGYLRSEDQASRILAIKGLESFKNTTSANLLIPILRNEKNDEVKIEIAKVLNKMGSPVTVTAFIGILNDPNGSGNLKKEIIRETGENPDGGKAILSILGFLGNSDKELRKVAAETIVRLYEADGKVIVNALCRGLLTNQDRLYLSEGSAILALLSDSDSIVTLTTLLKSSYPEVKKNATWAIYRIRPIGNIRIITELKKLVTSETEALEVRINAVRALGVCAVNDPVSDVWKTFTTTAKMRGEKYTMLRYFAIHALGELKTANDEILETLSKIAEKETSLMLQKEAVRSIRAITTINPEVERSLLSVFRKETDNDLKICIIETLGDMGSNLTENISSEYLLPSIDIAVRKRVIYALTKVGSEAAFSLILDTTSDKNIQEYIVSILQDADAETMISLIDKRLKTEDNGDIISVMESLQSGYAESF